jgi:hypothetical protein
LGELFYGVGASGENQQSRKQDQKQFFAHAVPPLIWGSFFSLLYHMGGRFAIAFLQKRWDAFL